MLTANPAGRFHALKRFLISAYSHNSGLLLGPSAFLTEAQRPSGVWWKNTQELSKYLLMISSAVNNHPQPKGRPALYLSTTMGLESFLPMLWEKDGLSCSFLKSASLTRHFALHVPLFPGHRRCTSSLRVLPTLHYSRRLYPVFWHFPVINTFLT